MDPAVEVLAEVEVKTASASMESKTKPSFRVAVAKVVEKP
jgi:hypothetical protein